MTVKSESTVGTKGQMEIWPQVSFKRARLLVNYY